MKHILCYGDSNTWGYIPVTGGRYDEHTRWTGVLQDTLGADFRVHEEGLNSRTTDFDESTKPFLNGLTTLPPVLASKKPLDCIILCLGTNDLKHGTTARSCEGLRRIIHLIRTFDTLYPSSTPVFREDVRILVLGPIGLSKAAGQVNPESDNASVIAEAARFPSLLRSLCEAESLDFLDLQSIASPSDADGMHMTAASHRAIGLAVAAKVNAMLR